MREKKIFQIGQNVPFCPNCSNFNHKKFLGIFIYIYKGKNPLKLVAASDQKNLNRGLTKKAETGNFLDPFHILLKTLCKNLCVFAKHSSATKLHLPNLPEKHFYEKRHPALLTREIHRDSQTFTGPENPSGKQLQFPELFGFGLKNEWNTPQRNPFAAYECMLPQCLISSPF